MTKLAFVDCESTGLDPERHEMWELAVIVRDGRWGNGEWLWQLPVDLAGADPNALRIGRFYERRSEVPHWVDEGTPAVRHPTSTTWERHGWCDDGTRRFLAAEYVANLLDGAHIVGAVPSFDASFIGPWLRRHGHAPTWHYHVVTVEALAAGFLARERSGQGALPWRSDDLSRAAGVEPPCAGERHTALGDARWAMRLYDAVMGSPPAPPQASERARETAAA